MRVVTSDEWTDHVARFRCSHTESVFRSGVSWLNSLVSEFPPRKFEEPAKAGALVGRVEYRPDGTRVYMIF